MNKNPVIQFYNNLSGKFDEEQDSFAFVRSPEKKLILSTFDKILTKDLSVLEIGAGTGRFTLEMAPHVKSVTAVDIAGKMLDQMKIKLSEKKITNVEVIHGDFLDISFQKTFDLVVSFSAIEYLKDLDPVFSKMSELTKKNGELIITTAHNTCFRWIGRIGNYFRQKVYMGAFSKHKMEKLLTEYGYKTIVLDDLVMKSFLIKGILLFIYAKKL